MWKRRSPSRPGLPSVISPAMSIIDGQKIWSTWAERADFGPLIARTSSDGPKHYGISLFILPLETDGVTVGPLRETTGECHFNETFFDGVRVPRENLIGELRRGWALAKITLANERMNLTTAARAGARARVPMTCSTSSEQAAASRMPRYANDSPAAGRRRRSWRSSTGGCFGHSLPDASPARSSRFARRWPVRMTNG
jgi:alkylation response protein AidB-like acyl-CoA dehydrogenase